MSSEADCGCGSAPVQPGNQLIVGPGTHIVQQPCAATPAQSVAVTASPFGGGSIAGAGNDSCSVFALPTVARSFTVPGTGQTGSFFADCAGNWGLPGLLMYFPSQGQLEILGVSQGTVTYRNRTVAPGTEILSGIRFAVGIPMPPVEVVDSGDDDGGPVTSEPVYQDSVQLSNVRGVLNSIPSRVLPVTNHVLVGRQGYWQRRALGQMRYPVAKSRILSAAQTAQTKSWTLPLPGKPVLPEEVDGFAVELHVRLWVDRDGDPGNFLSVRAFVEGFHVIHAGSSRYREENSVGHICQLPKDATTLTVSTTRMQSLPGNMEFTIDLLAYHY